MPGKQRRLRTFVHVTDETMKAHAFGPGNTVPDWAVPLITNPKAWEPDQKPAQEPPPPNLNPDPGTGQPGGNGAALQAPPRGGAGSGKDAWAAYATGLGLTVHPEMERDDIVDLVDKHHAEQAAQQAGGS